MKEFDSKRVWGPKPRYPNALSAKGTEDLIIIAGPCSIESKAQLETVAREVAAQQGSGRDVYLRGGIYKAGTYPPPSAEFGLQPARLQMLYAAGKKFGLKTIAEVLDVRLVRHIAPMVDAFQVGARHCQDYALLEELAKHRKPVTLKRNMGMTLDEFMGAAEYLARGKCQPILIERGTASQMNHVRWDLSISLIAAVKAMTNLPILVDASHGTGRRDLVESMTYAGMAAGANGFLVETHPNPCKSLTDTDQAFPLDRLDHICRRAECLHHLSKSWRNH